MSFQNNIIAIPPKQLNGYGDCLSSIIHLIFKYQGKSNYEIMFLNQGELKYTPAENVNIAFNTNELLVLPEKDYLDKLNIYLDTKFINKNSIEDIKQTIDENQPIIYLGSAYDMPWRRQYGAQKEERHACLIVGYDDCSKHYICVDPIFESKLLMLPYNNIEYSNLNNIVGYLDFLKSKDIPDYDIFQLKYYFRADDFDCTYSFESLEKLVKDIYAKYASGNLMVENYYNYLLNNRTWFFLIGRTENIYLFFKYLLRNYHYPWIDDIVDMAFDECSKLRIASNLVLKFSRTGKNSIITSVLDKIRECAEIERRMNIILQDRIN